MKTPLARFTFVLFIIGALVLTSTTYGFTKTDDVASGTLTLARVED